MDNLTKYNEQMEGAGTPGGMTDLEFFPKTGDFMLWPSYLLHTVPRGKARDMLNYERISVSFNLQHAEDLGEYHHGDNFDYGFLDEQR